MAERDSWAITGGIDQEDARMAIGALLTPGSTAINVKSGFRPGPGSTTPGTVYATGTPDANVHVQPFQAFLQTARATPGGPYILTLDAVKDINILSTPANATNPRNDLIIAHQADTFYGDGNSLMSVRQVVGTPSGTPTDPSLAAFPNCIQLARVRVNANATTITSGNITDLRATPLYTVALGGLLPVTGATARGTLTGMYDGFAIRRTDRDWTEIYDGSGWRVQGVAVVSSVGELTSVITSPYTGQQAVDSVTGYRYHYNGTKWMRLAHEARISSGLVVTNSTTQVAASGLSFPVEVNGVYSVEIFLNVFGTTGVGLLPGATMPTGALWDCFYAGWNDANGVYNHLNVSGGGNGWVSALGFGYTGSLNVSPVIFRGTVTNGANAGTFQITGAQRVANATSSQILTQSWIKHRQIA